MSSIGLVVIWYLLGLAGCVLGKKADRTLSGKDFTVEDLLLTLILSLFGGLLFLFGLFYFLSRVDFGSRVLIKGKRNEWD
ncbi:hypothetical protein [Pseudomonas phage vB_PseuGesM_254]|uniref:Uncharacterized protein n=1 Tax=Pseudomonas phage vB_PseuGesM_254 TaxID=3092638 RepID=A0AAX4G6P8_9CAUD|nr:hypothetical protein [Pseudomonas phage PseuGes_254]